MNGAIMNCFLKEPLEIAFKFERLVFDLSSRLKNLAPDDVDANIYEALSLVGKFKEADRSFFFRFNQVPL
jgi:hypothetical protein